MYELTGNPSHADGRANGGQPASRPASCAVEQSVQARRMPGPCYTWYTCTKKIIQPTPLNAVIGIGAAVTRRPLPHHRAYGSVHGGSRWLSQHSSNNDGSPSDLK